MKLIVGLGNPGPQYEVTRHNIGFLAIDRLIERFKAHGPQEKYHSEMYGTQFEGEKVILLKPQTFMNLSGKAVAPAFRFFKCQPSDLIVIYDDLDLKEFTLRLRSGGGAGGHNGIRSLDEHLGGGDKDYFKVRCGIGRPKAGKPVDYVLEPFSDLELTSLDPFLDKVSQAVEELLRGRLKEAMNQFNSKGDGSL